MIRNLLLPRLLPAALLGLMAILAGGAAWRESTTIDETAHIGAGLSYVQKLDLRFNEEHPPLAKVLTGLSLALAGVHVDYAGPAWTASDRFFSAYGGQWLFGGQLLTRWNDPQRTLALARLPMLLLTLVFGWCLFLFARQLGGDCGGILCLTVFATTPLFLALAPLVITDMTIAFFSLLTIWALAEMWHYPQRRNILLFAAAFAAALLSKYSAGILFIAIAATVTTMRIWPVEGAPVSKPRLLALGKGLAGACALVYAFYFLLSWNTAIDIPGLDGKGFFETLAGRLLMPPWRYGRGVFMFLLNSPVNTPRYTYLLGRYFPNGTLLYFPILLLFKSSLGFVGLSILTLVLSLWRRKRGGHSEVPLAKPVHWRVLWVCCVVFAGICMLSRLNSGFRHFSVPLTLLILMLGVLPRRLALLRSTASSYGRLASYTTALLTVACLVSAVNAYPYYIPYVNALGTGRPTWRIVTGSDLDWGQSLPTARQFAETHDLPAIPVDPYSLADIKAFVPQGQLWNCQSPSISQAGMWAVISSNAIPHRCKWLMAFPHEELAGGALIAVQLPARIPPAGSPGGPPASLPGSGHWATRSLNDLPVLFLDLLDHPEKFKYVATQLNTSGAAMLNGVVARVQRKLAGE